MAAWCTSRFIFRFTTKVIVSVISVKVPERVKEKMKLTKDKVDWPQEIRAFIEGKVEELERRERVEKVERMLANLPAQAQGTAAELVKHDRVGH